MDSAATAALALRALQTFLIAAEAARAYGLTIEEVTAKFRAAEAAGRDIGQADIEAARAERLAAEAANRVKLGLP